MLAYNSSVIAAIPNYNHGEALAEMLPIVLEQEYQDVVVCDDASTDSTMDVLTQFKNEVEAVNGTNNVGAGSNRNKILQSAALQKAGRAFIHFMDADTLLLSDRTPERIVDAMDDPTIGELGGLVINEDSSQHFYNYGPPLFGPRNFIYTVPRGVTMMTLDKLGEHNTQLAKGLRNKVSDWLDDAPNRLEEPQARDAFWVIESNLAIDSLVFEKAGGFDPSLRFHETQDLAIKLSKAGFHGRFEPGIEVVQRAIDVRGGNFNRNMQAIKAFGRLMWRYKTFGTSWRKSS